MTIKIKRIILFTLVLIIAFMLFLSACGKKSENEEDTELQSLKYEQTKMEPPDSLLNIETQINNIIKDLGGPYVSTDEEGSQQQNTQQSDQEGSQKQSAQQDEQQQNTQESSQQQNTQQSDQQQGSQKQSTQQDKQQQNTQQGSQQQNTQQSDQEQGSQKQSAQQDDQQQNTQQGSQQQTTQQSDQQQGSQKQSAQQDDQQQNTQQSDQERGSQKQSAQQGGQLQNTQQGGQNVDWANITKLIDDLHFQWNEYMPEIAVSSTNLIRTFSDNLNSLTTTSVEQNRVKALFLANELYSSIPDFYSLYNSEISPEVKRITYYVRKIIIESGNNWDQAVKDSEELNNSWSLLKRTLSREQDDAEKKLDFSIYEMKTVISQKSKQLTDIKGRIVLSNVQELEQTYKNKNKNKK